MTKGMNKFPIKGVELRRNPKNKFLVFQLHYEADPAKRSIVFRNEIRSSMPKAQYLQEYELQWDSFAGMPVYTDWDLKRHGSQSLLYPESGLPLLRGWDFGLTPACVIAQLQGAQLVVLKEFTELNMGAEKFSTKVLKECQILFPEWSDNRRNWRDFIDASGEFRKDTDEGTCAQILDAKGLSCMPGAIAWVRRRQSVEDFLVRQNKEGPLFRISIADCPVLVRGFNGGYRYPEKSAEIEPMKLRPIKDEHSHPHDALQMITSKLMMVRNRSTKAVPTPAYGRGR